MKGWAPFAATQTGTDNVVHHYKIVDFPALSWSLGGSRTRSGHDLALVQSLAMIVTVLPSPTALFQSTSCSSIHVISEKLLPKQVRG